MYTAFNLKIGAEYFNDFDDLCIEGTKRKAQLQKHSKTELEKFITSEGLIDGTGLSEDWFQTVQSDVFISHSHNDQKLAFAVAGWLTKKFRLNVFMDEVIWGSADELLRTIDNKYCWKSKSKTYDYKKRNLTTSHIHAMLSTAIYSVMDRTEIVIFLNTSKSLPNVGSVLDEDSKYTLSPWIYQELMATKLLRITNWSEYRQKAFLEHSQPKYELEKLKIAYKTPVDDLTLLDEDKLNQWLDNYGNRDMTLYGELSSEISSHPLDYLYDIVFEKEYEK